MSAEEALMFIAESAEEGLQIEVLDDAGRLVSREQLINARDVEEAVAAALEK